MSAARCTDHLSFTEETCPDCGLPVDEYGNTEAQFEHCCFPDCGCDGARLCMAGEASDSAAAGNVEAMWTGKTKAQRKAVFNLLGMIAKEKK